MGLAQAHAPVNHEGVEGGGAGFVGHRKSRRAGQPVAIALYVILEIVRRVELRIKVIAVDGL